MTSANATSSSESASRYRPTTRLCIPLQTGNGFAMSLFMWGFFWMPALALALVRHAADLNLVLCALVAPLLLTIALAGLASVVAARRVAVRAVTVEFAAIAPPAPGVSRVRRAAAAAQGTEQLVRWLFLAVIGAPALWGALAALRFLWARL